MTYEDFLAAFQIHGSHQDLSQTNPKRDTTQSNYKKKETAAEEMQDAESVASQLKSKILSHHEVCKYYDKTKFKMILVPNLMMSFSFIKLTKLMPLQSFGLKVVKLYSCWCQLTN